MDEESKKKVLQYIARGLRPPSVAFSQAVLLHDFSVLIRIRMKDETFIFGWLDAQDNLWMIDEYEWLYKGVYKSSPMSATSKHWRYTNEHWPQLANTSSHC
jgi:hypothetical protein